MLEEGGVVPQVTLARPQGKVRCPDWCILESATVTLIFWACLCSCPELADRRTTGAWPTPPCVSRSALGPVLLPSCPACREAHQYRHFSKLLCPLAGWLSQWTMFGGRLGPL